MSNAITSAWLTNNLALIEFDKKIPWLTSYMKKIKALARDLYRKHSKSQQNPS